MTSNRLPPIGEELYEFYPGMSAQTHEAAVKEYARAALSEASALLDAKDARIAELKIRLKEADAEACAGRVISGRQKTLMADAAKVLRDTTTRAEAAEARLSKALEVMKPFADLATQYDPPDGDDQDLPWGLYQGDITLGHLRAARAFIEEQGE